MGADIASQTLFQGDKPALLPENPRMFGQIAIPSGDSEQPAEHSDADDAMGYTLAHMHAEPLARHNSYNGTGHGGPETECSPDHPHRVPRIARSEDVLRVDP